MSTRRTIACLVAAALAAALPACRGGPPDPRAPGPPSTAPEPAPADARDAPRLRHATAVVNGIRMHYVVAGRGPPVVLLHGFPQTWYCWRKVIPALAREHTVIVPDLRGAGRSSLPPGGYDKQTMAADVRALVRRLGHRRVGVVGHDLGAWTAYAYARTYRDEVTHLGFLEASLPGFGLDRLLDFSGPRSGVWHLAFFRQPDVPERLLDGRERYFIEDFLGVRRARPDTFDGGAVDRYVRAYSRPGRMHAALEQYRALYRDAADNRAGAGTALTAPVLALGGSRATATGPAASMRMVARNVSGGEVRGAGHWLMEERPRELSERLLAFLR